MTKKNLQKEKDIFFQKEQAKWAQEWLQIKGKLEHDGKQEISNAHDKLFKEEKAKWYKELSETKEKTIIAETERLDMELKHSDESIKKIIASQKERALDTLAKLQRNVDKESISYIKAKKEEADKYLADFYKKPTNVSSLFCSDKRIKNSCVIAIYKDDTGEVIRNGDFDENIFDFIKKRLVEVDNDPKTGKTAHKGKSVNMLVDLKTM